MRIAGDKEAVTRKTAIEKKRETYKITRETGTEKIDGKNEEKKGRKSKRNVEAGRG